MPAFIEPQLATLVDRAPTGDDWLHELKYDGYRILARLHKGRATLTSRRGNDWTSKFPTVRAAVEALPVGQAYLDGEVAVPTADGKTSFQALQNAFGQTTAGVLYYVFDLLFLDDRDLTGDPLEARKEALASLIARSKAGPLRYSDHVVGRGAEFFEQARARGLEGIVSKRRGDPYYRGRSTGWLKVKAISRQELVIGGYTDPEGSRTGIGALLMGYYDKDGNFVFAGKVGTGFTQKLLAELHRRLTPLVQKQSPFAVTPPQGWLGRTAHWTRPELVGEVAFTEWTDDGRLRHPSFQGLREDKKARQVIRETPTSTGRATSMADEAKVEAMPKTAATTKTKPAPKPTAKATAKAKSTAKPATKPEARPKARPPAALAVRTTAKATVKPVKSTAKGDAAAVLGERISNPDRVVYPALGLTKLDVARYYEAVGEAMLPHVHGRPLSLVRCPQGLAGGCFYMKHQKMPASDSLSHITIREKTKTGQYLVAETEAALVGLAQMGVLEVHTWNSTREELERPDRIILDLDPGPDVKWPEVVETARLIRDRLKALGLASFVKTTGGKGLHVVCPFRPALDWDDCLELSRAVADLIARERPRRYTLNMAKAGREDKILIDYLRNNRGSTAVAAYSTRARPEATVSVPISWDELSPGLTSGQFTVKTVPHRLATLKGDPWAGFFDHQQRLSPELLSLVQARGGG
jgi:bifunctional non-homologous end joining protein LigD